MLGRLSGLAYPLVRMMPVAVASELLAVVVRRLADYCVRLDKMRGNLRSAFPELEDRALDDMARRIAANLGRQIAEMVHIPSFVAGRRGARLEAAGALEYPSGQKGPAIYVSGHLGNWELLPIVLRRYGVALLVDQNVISGIDVEFFGRPTRLTHLPGRMALKFGCPIIPAEAVRLGPGHLKAVFHEPIWPGGQAGENAAQELTQRMASVIEGCIRRHPDEWFCNKRRWKGKRGAGLNPSSSGAMLPSSD